MGTGALPLLTSLQAMAMLGLLVQGPLSVNHCLRHRAIGGLELTVGGPPQRPTHGDTPNHVELLCTFSLPTSPPWLPPKTTLAPAQEPETCGFIVHRFL